MSTPITPNLELIDEVERLQTVQQEMLRSGGELVAAQTRMQSLLHNISDAVIQFESDGTIQSFNRAAEHIFGYSEIEIMYQGAEKTVPCSPEYAGDVPRFLDDYCRREADQYMHPLLGRHYDGRELLLQCSVARIDRTELTLFTDDGAQEAEQDNEYGAFLCILRDITERKRADEELRRHRDHLQELVDERTGELLVAMEAAESANRVKSEFLANTSHELRSPMNAILSFADLGKKKIESAKREKLEGYFSRIHTAGSQLLALINDLLDLAKMEGGRMVYDMEDDNALVLITEICDEFEGLLTDKSLHLDVQCDVEVTRASFDRIRVGQVIRNLLSNAIKFTDPERTITVAVSAAELMAGRRKSDAGSVPGMSIAVIDQGVGIPEELEAVFDKFTQSSKTRRNGGGTGLGLAISREIITANGGVIRADNNVDGGSRFTFLLPIRHPSMPNKQPST